MNTYHTAEVARRIGVHPNTVRLYAALGLIPEPERGPNGYRVFTDVHLEQFKLARTAFKVEVLQNGLRKQAVGIVKTSAAGDYDGAARLTRRYLHQIQTEQRNAEEAVSIAEKLLSGEGRETNGAVLTRKETADSLGITIDTLRNWELNGLLTVRRRQNGYRVYTDADIRRLKIIRSLRCANYSLTAILRLLNALSGDPGADIRAVIDTPGDQEDIISACDKLLTSLRRAGQNAGSMLRRLGKMKKMFPANPTL